MYRHLEGWILSKKLGEDPRLWTKSVCIGSEKGLSDLSREFMDEHGLPYHDMAFDLSLVEVDWYGDIVGLCKVCTKRLAGGIVMPIAGPGILDKLSSEAYMSIGGVYVIERLRRHGIGKKLVECVTEDLGKIGCQWVHWKVSVDYSLGHRFSHGIGAELLYIGGGQAHYSFKSYVKLNSVIDNRIQTCINSEMINLN